MEKKHVELALVVFISMVLGVLLANVFFQMTTRDIERFQPCVDSMKGLGMPENTTFVVFGKLYPDGMTSCIAYPTKYQDKFRYEVDAVQTRPYWILAGGSVGWNGAAFDDP